MKKILSGMGIALITLLGWIIRIILRVLKLVLELAKIFLLLFCMIARVFLAFIRAGTS